MSPETTLQDQSVTFDCLCGKKVTVSVGELGRTTKCAHCERYLRPGLSMVLVPQSKAKSVTLLCPKGHFIVSSTVREGRVVKCEACQLHLVVPPFQKRAPSRDVVRIPQSSLRRVVQPEKPSIPRRRKEHVSVESLAAFGGRKCVNPMCRGDLAQGENVCRQCGTNNVTGQVYMGKDPARDPFKRFWPGPLNW